MSRYLSALKISENGGATALQNLQNPLEDSFVGFVGTPPPRFEINQAANDNDRAADNLACFRWLIHFTDREPVEGTFSPRATHAEVLAHWPGAVAAEPLPDRRGRVPTASESAMLCALVTAIYQDDTDDDRNEAMQSALADPDNALACYTAIASERGRTPHDADDRRTCHQCSNLRGASCSVATPGGNLSAQRGYRPGALWLDEPHRCETFTERKI